MKGSYLFVLFIGVLLAIAAAYHKFGAISFSGLETPNVGTLLLGALFTALIIERAVEVVVNNKFAASEFKATHDINVSRQAVTIAEEALKHETELRLADSSSPSASALVAQKADVLSRMRDELRSKRDDLNDEKTRARAELEQLRFVKQSFAATMATVLGMLAAIAGVRILGQFIDGDVATQFTSGSWQLYLFFFADIILTALLLAGGADGIHELTKDFYGKRKDVLAPQKT